MATAPVLAPTESRAMGPDAENLQFQRLERVRAQRRARRRYRLFLATALVLALAVASVLGFTIIRHTSFERLGSPSAPAPIEMLRPAAASPAATGSALGPPSTVVAPPDTVVPPPPRADAVKRDTTQPSRIQVEADRRASPPSDTQSRGAVAPPREAPRDAEAVDPMAAIDWLLNTSQRR